MTDPYIQCRLFGHAWDQIPSIPNKTQMGPQIWLRCTRCSGERRDTVRFTDGSLMARRYEKPINYSRERVPFADLRVEFVRSRPKRKRKTA